MRLQWIIVGLLYIKPYTSGKVVDLSPCKDRILQNTLSNA